MVDQKALRIKKNGVGWKITNIVSKLSLFFASLYLFILAINLMKEGAGGLAPLMDGYLSIDSPANSLGFGWVFAYLIMSGSPVAASALAFLNNGTIDQVNAFSMITGSRLGASFIVILIGIIYILRGRDRAASLSMGMLSFLVTLTTYIPSFFIGLYLIRWGVLDSFSLNSGQNIQSVFERFINPIVDIISNAFVEWAVFLIGLGIIMVSFSLFDRCLPQMALKESQFGRVSRLVYHPLVMFTLGAGITLLSMSVSLSLSILIPLSNRGFIRRENVIPYIMGANITTFIDTLLAAALLDLPSAFTIVLVCMVSISIVSIMILVSINRFYQASLLSLVNWITSNKRNYVVILVIIILVPIILLFL